MSNVILRSLQAHQAAALALPAHMWVYLLAEGVASRCHTNLVETTCQHAPLWLINRQVICCIIVCPQKAQKCVLPHLSACRHKALMVNPSVLQATFHVQQRSHQSFKSVAGTLGTQAQASGVHNGEWQCKLGLLGSHSASTMPAAFVLLAELSAWTGRRQAASTLKRARYRPACLSFLRVPPVTVP
jgi:hypothetical protein